MTFSIKYAKAVYKNYNVNVDIFSKNYFLSGSCFNLHSHKIKSQNL